MKQRGGSIITGPALLAVILAAGLLSGCAVGQRKAQLQETLQFERVDSDGDGVISRAEWDTMKAQLQSLRRR